MKTVSQLQSAQTKSRIQYRLRYLAFARCSVVGREIAVKLELSDGEYDSRRVHETSTTQRIALRKDAQEKQKPGYSYDAIRAGEQTIINRVERGLSYVSYCLGVLSCCNASYCRTVLGSQWRPVVTSERRDKVDRVCQERPNCNTIAAFTEN